jgi:uncharacterized membrane protein
MIGHRHLRYWITFCALLAASGFIAALYLPHDAMLPIHWNLAGEPDRFVNKWEAAATIPASAALLSLLMAWLPTLPAFRKNMGHNMPVYNATWAAVLAVLGFAQYTVFAGAFGLQAMMPEGLFLLVALLLGLLGNYMPKLKPSPLIGIRTPWTLRNEEVWVKTHRFGGALTVGAAVAIAASVLLGFSAQIIETIFVSSMLTVVFISALSSYLLWRKIETRTK